MTRDFDDSWLPPLEDEGEELVEAPGSEGFESSRPARRSGIRSISIGPLARRAGGILLVLLVGVAVWWGVQQLLLPPPAVPVPTEWSPPTTEAPGDDATPTPGAHVGDDATPEPAGPDNGATFVPGQTLVVTGTDGEGISFRSAPGLDTTRIVILEESATLTVLDGPDVADGYSWWHLETADGTSGWAVENWLAPAESP